MPVIESSGRTVDFLDHGRGEPVVLVHSTGMAAGQWRGVIDRLGGAGGRYRLAAPNLHGYGRSSRWPDDRRLELDAEVAMLRAVIDHCGAPAHLVGHSYGGLLALSLARRAGADLASLTLIEPVSIGALRSENEAGALTEIDRMQRLFFAAYESGDAARAMEHFVDYWDGAGAWRGMPEAQRLFIFARARKMYREIQLMWDDPAPLAAYGSVRAPTLILVGENTTRAARRISEVLARGMAAAERRDIPGGRHMAPMRQPAVVAGLIAAHLEAHPIG